MPMHGLNTVYLWTYISEYVRVSLLTNPPSTLPDGTMMQSEIDRKQVWAQDAFDMWYVVASPQYQEKPNREICEEAQTFLREKGYDLQLPKVLRNEIDMEEAEEPVEQSVNPFTAPLTPQVERVLSPGPESIDTDKLIDMYEEIKTMPEGPEKEQKKRKFQELSQQFRGGMVKRYKMRQAEVRANGHE